MGERFLNTLENYLESVKHYPEHYQVKRRPYREVFTKDFPCVISYKIEDEKVIIDTVFCKYKNPKKKPKK